MLVPPQSLHLLLSLLCSQMLVPPQSLQLFLWRLCSQILAPPQSLHWAQQMAGVRRRAGKRKTSGERNPSYNDEPCAQSSRGKPEKRRAGRRRRPAPFFRLTFGLAWTRRTRVSRGDGAVEGAAE
jgi:hypothetical protein